MAISDVTIANMALSNISTNSEIEILTEDSPEAKQCKLWFDLARMQALEAYDWNFARKRQALTLHNDAPPDEWLYRYQYPSDCVAIRRMVNPAGPKAPAIPFEVEASNDGSTKTILTNLESAVAVFTFDQRQISTFTLHFVGTFAALLAHYIAFKLTGKRSIKGDMLNLYRAFIKTAPAMNANEKVDDAPRDADWIAGR